MTREEAIQEVNKAFEPAFANYIITALTEDTTMSDKCEDCVSRAKTMEIRKSRGHDNSAHCISELPSVTPVSCIATVKFSREDLQEIVDEKVKELTGERKKGHWIESESYPGKWYCSECGGIHHDTETDEWREVFDFRYAYCPLCGIEMENKG